MAAEFTKNQALPVSANFTLDILDGEGAQPVDPIKPPSWSIEGNAKIRVMPDGMSAYVIGSDAAVGSGAVRAAGVISTPDQGSVTDVLPDLEFTILDVTVPVAKVGGELTASDPISIADVPDEAVEQ